jgi:succinate dehydrogenase / fumarate reductase cytochrome b subunit
VNQGNSQTGSIFEQHHGLLRRLHSLTGIVPIGVFLIAHLVTNSSIVWGGGALRETIPGLRDPAFQDPTFQDRGVAYFQKEVSWINTQVPHLLLIEITLWASIAFHSVLGVMYARSGRSNVRSYDYAGNWRYTLQRVSGYLGILFIFYHVATLRWGWTWLVPGGTAWSHEFAASTLAAALHGGSDGIKPLGYAVAMLYFVGVSMLVFHFANGLWTAAITWGLTISAHAQKRWGYACTALGIGLMALAWMSLLGAYTLDANKARSVERSLSGHVAERK